MLIIEIQDLVANALIELLENNSNRAVSFKQISDYGDAVITRLKMDNKEAYLFLSKTEDFIHDYTNLFFIDENKNEIVLKESVSVDELKVTFRKNLSLDVFLALVSKEALNVLGVSL